MSSCPHCDDEPNCSYCSYPRCVDCSDRDQWTRSRAMWPLFEAKYCDSCWIQNPDSNNNIQCKNCFKKDATVTNPAKWPFNNPEFCKSCWDTESQLRVQDEARFLAKIRGNRKQDHEIKSLENLIQAAYSSLAKIRGNKKQDHETKSSENLIQATSCQDSLDKIILILNKESASGKRWSQEERKEITDYFVQRLASHLPQKEMDVLVNKIVEMIRDCHRCESVLGVRSYIDLILS